MVNTVKSLLKAREMFYYEKFYDVLKLKFVAWEKRNLLWEEEKDFDWDDDSRSIVLCQLFLEAPRGWTIDANFIVLF